MDKVAKLLEEARKFIEYASEELDKGLRDGREEAIRDAAEKAWLAVVKAIEALLIAKGYGEEEIKTYRQKRLALDSLSVKDPDVRSLGLRDRFGARGYHLHIRAFYDGEYTPEALREELRKAREMIRDISVLLGVSN